MRLSLPFVPLLLLPACVGAVEPIDEPAPIDGDALPVLELPDGGGMCEDIGVAECALSACTAACIGVALLGCGAVAGICVSSDIISLGTMTVPCAFGIVAACGISGGSALENCSGACGDRS